MGDFRDLPSDMLGIMLHVAVKQITGYSDASAAGDEVAAFHVRVGSSLLTQVIVALRLRAEAGETEAQGLLDEFDRWFYTVPEKPVAH